jgi:uncharacterized protein (DUF427 family)
VSLTLGTGPFGERPAGRFDVLERPEAVLYWESLPYRVRAVFERETVVDSRDVKLLHESGRLPLFYFPQPDVRLDLLEPSGREEEQERKGRAVWLTLRLGERVAPDAAWRFDEPVETASFLAGHVALVWRALDEWFVEDEQVFGHPRDPYSRIDVYTSSRHVRVLRDGEVLAETRRAKALVETGLPVRWYIPPEDVRTELLVPSSRRTRCAYKGSATHWSVRVGDRVVDDLVWAYLQPELDAQPVRDHYCFYNERVDLELDGETGERPQTQWSRDD